METKQRCEGNRREFRGGGVVTFRCRKNAKGSVETQVGFTERHPCCGGEQCIRSIAKGYPAEWKPYTEVNR